MITEASDKYGKPVPTHTEYRKWVEAAGFVDVQEHLFKIPCNGWAKDRKLKEIGRYQCLNYCEGLDGISIGLFTRVLDWEPAEFEVFMAKVRTELKIKAIHTYQHL